MLASLFCFVVGVVAVSSINDINLTKNEGRPKIIYNIHLKRVPRIDPQQLLNCLSVLLASNGGIKTSKEVNRLVQLMGKFSKKLVSKCIYVQILKSTETELLGQFMADGGWALSHTWLQDGILSRNWPLVQELLELMLLCPVDIQRLKSNSAPKLVKGLSKEGGNEGVRILASKLVEQWLKIVKGETPSVPQQPKPDQMVNVLNVEITDVKQDTEENGESPNEAEDIVDPLEIPVNHVPTEDDETKERLAKAKSDGLVFKITVKDGKQVLAKVESSPKKDADENKGKIKVESKVKPEPIDGKKQIKEKVKKEILEDKPEAHKKIEKIKNDMVTKDKSKERRSSKELKETRDAKELVDVKEPKESKEKEKRKESSRSSSSKHSSTSGSSRSSSHKSSRSSSDSKHKSSKSRDKSKDNERDRDRDRSSKSSSSFSKTKSSSSTKSNQPKERQDSVDEKVSQSMKDKETLTKVAPPSINKLGKIPKKPAADTEVSADSVGSKKSSISIEVKKDAENRPKTVKTFNSQFRSHGLAEEAPPPPSRRGLQRPSSQPTIGASIPTPNPTKRTSPPPEKKETIVPEKKLKLDIAVVAEKPGIKLIPAKPKTPVLVESDMFMDAIFASQTTKKDGIRKRKRLPSQSTAETTKPEKVQSPDSKSVAPKFYQDTLDNESKDDEKTEDQKKMEVNTEMVKEKESNVGSVDIEMKDENNSNESKEVESVIAENKKPPGPGCGPNGPPGVLTILKRKGPKKQLRWRPQESLEEIRFFELDETERINVSRSSVDMSQLERFNEREGEAFLIARKLNSDDLMAEQVPWKPLIIVDDVPPHPQGSSSKEKKIQSDREKTCLHAIYFNRSMIPESPAEPDMEQYQITDAAIIPLDDANGSPEGIKSFVNYPWPEPRGELPNQPTGFDEQQPFTNFQQNFPFNNQHNWTQTNLPPAFNGAHNMLNMNSIQPESMNNMNMNINAMPPYQHNPNFCPPNGMRNNFNNNFGNDGRDARMLSGQSQNNSNWFRPNGPIGQQNNWRPPMGNNNGRQRPEWNPRNVCRAFAKGFCRIGEKCQWLHPGINCPPFN
ncbi:Serine/threonine-protein phosphatase 1 regulatory subunit 10 [Pseudolycoriella hygida]|uniref:Serine/threonine-protein phosphatase 1 regulatory subunit 10 n=1 Tax=Pseudolycoriella hygida TaxID=35572 RepID=A0A9Q0S996_9DIPT|nr:Serine/threonine-protein phosphatase 1 regulatory subunit 10 [Pseudolycoriella hygida]